MSSHTQSDTRVRTVKLLIMDDILMLYCNGKIKIKKPKKTYTTNTNITINGNKTRTIVILMIKSSPS